MRRNILTVVFALVCLTAFSQKKQIRHAENAIEDGNYAKAKTLLKKASTQLADESENTKADFYLTKAKAYLGPKKGASASYEDLLVAVKAFKKLKTLDEKETAERGIQTVRNALVNSAIKDQKAKKFSSAANKLYKSYMMGKKDTIYLYYAANLSVSAKNYKKAAKYFEKLMDLGYTGVHTKYIATNKETGKTKAFATEAQRDMFIKSGKFTNPQKKTTKSKRGEIAKTLVQIYISQDKPKKAKKAIAEAKKAIPGKDSALMQAEANMYYKLGNIEKYNQIIKEVIKIDPNNASLFYNLGVTSAKLGDKKSAIKYYKKAIELKPDYENAYLNIAATILGQEKAINKKMNKALKNNNFDKYDKLKAKKKPIYKKALPYLKKVHEINPNNIEAIRTMRNIYSAMGKTEKVKALKAKLSKSTK